MVKISSIYHKENIHVYSGLRLIHWSRKEVSCNQYLLHMEYQDTRVDHVYRMHWTV